MVYLGQTFNYPACQAGTVYPSNVPTFPPMIGSTSPSASPTPSPTPLPTLNPLDELRNLIYAQQTSINHLNEQMLNKNSIIKTLKSQMDKKTKDIDAIRQDIVGIKEKLKRVKG